MFKKMFLPVLLAGSFCAHATFVTVPVTGFNQDAIANGIGNANTSTTAPVDLANWDLVASTFQATAVSAFPTASLPASGLINSVGTPGLSFQLANYTGNNDLVLSALNASGTLTFTTNYRGDVFVLGFTGNGPTTCDIKVTFTDNTFQTFTGISYADWYGGTGYAIQNIGRIDRTTNTMEAPAGDPRLYEKKLALSAANTDKLIASVTVTKTSASGVLNILAVSVCQAPAVTLQPINRVICSNGSTAFGVTSPSAPTYQWQVNTGAGFLNVSNSAIYSGATTNTLSLVNVPAGYNNYQYRCAMTSVCGTVNYTQPALLTVTPEAHVTSLPATIDACEGGAAQINVLHSGTALSYKWQMKTSTTGGIYVDVPNAFPYSGVNTATLDIVVTPDTLQGSVFRCIITASCNTEISADVLVNVTASPYFSVQPADVSVQPYNGASFEVVIVGIDYVTYWQSSSNGIDYVNINDNSLYFGTKKLRVNISTVHPSMDGSKFRCILKSTNPVCAGFRDTSDAGKIKVEFPNNITSLNLDKEGVVIYPNPVTGNTIFIDAADGITGTKADIQIADVLGKVVYRTNILLSRSNKVILPATMMPGSYNLLLSGKNLQKSIQIFKK